MAKLGCTSFSEFVSGSLLATDWESRDRNVKNDKKEKKEMTEKNLQDPQWQKCLLCQSHQIEDMPHLWVCPATAKEQVILQLQAEKFIHDSLLFSDNKMEPRQFCLRRGWLCQGRLLLRSNAVQRQITETKLVMLTRDFWNANKYKEFIPRHGFSRAPCPS